MDLEVAEVFADRFPRYALTFAQWEEMPLSRHADQAWLVQLSLEHTEVLYLYGIDAEAALLLPNQRLVFLEPQEGRIVHFLHHPKAKEILERKDVEIYHLKRGLLQELAERYPVRGIGFAPIPEYAGKKEVARTKLQLFRKTGLTHAHFLDRLHSHIPLSNLLRNLPQLSSSFYVNHLKDAFVGIPAIICGAGPSLAASFEALRTLESKALIIAGGSAIAALSAQGIAPHFAMAIDPNPDELERLKNSFAFEVPFLFSSRLFPACFSTCNGPFGYVRSGMSGIAELWFEEELGLKEPILGDKLPSEALSVTTLSAALAVHLGCNPILFDGLDLAYTGNRRYADGVGATETMQAENVQPIDRHLEKRDKHGKKVTSAVRWVMESQALSTFARRSSHRRWINCTASGLGLKGVESMPLLQAKELLQGEYDLRGMIHAALAEVPMPKDTETILKQKTEELRRSLEAVLQHLNLLVQEPESGRAILAELDLKEELASQILFFDIEKILRDDPAFWKTFLGLAQNCLKVFTA